MGSSVDPGRPNLPTLYLPRILSPDEYRQAQGMTPSQMQQQPFPLTAPDQTKRLNPNSGKPDRSVGEQVSGAITNASPAVDAGLATQGISSGGLGGILTRQVAAPLAAHPMIAAGMMTPPGAVVGFGLMAHDLYTYARQKYDESQMTPEDRAKAEANPNRVSGEQAGTEAAMLALAPVIHAGVKSLGAEGVEGAEGATSAGAAEGVVPRQPMPGETPAGLQLKENIAQHANDVADAWNSIVAPASRTPQATQAANILRATTGEAAAQYEQAAFKLDEFRRAIEPLPDADKLGFIDAIEGGRSQVNPEWQAPADAIRKTLDDARDQIRALGTGKLDQFIENYFPHIWTDPDRATDVVKIFGSKSPMEGPKSFLKERTIPTTLEGMQQGLVPVSTNPVDLTLLKLREMQRYLMAHQSLAEMKDQGLVKFVRSGDMADDGYARIDDKIATVFGKPTVTVSEAFDVQQRQGIVDAIKNLGGVSLDRPTSIPRGKGLQAGTLGYAEGDRAIVAKFGTHDGVIMHELGHIIDNRFGVGEALSQAPNGPAELRDLANLRAESLPNADAQYKAYIQKPGEQAANALHAYLHTPERMQEVAPNVYKALDDILASRPELQPIREIKPSVELGTNKAEVPVGGMVIRGQYYAPEPVAKIVNNYLSPGLRGNPIYDAYRGLGNTLNQAQLGFSAFHLGFTSMDATVSRAALALEHLASGDVGKAAVTAATAPAAPLPGIVQGLVGDYVNKALGTDIQLGLGAKIRQAYLTGEGSPEMQALANAVKEAGGRVTQDSFYRNSAPENMLKAWREGSPLKAAAYSPLALMEAVTRPIMEHVVPLQKLQVFGEMAQKVLGDLPPDATLADRRAALSKAWDSVDNRMGQVVYDNLFWNKTFKDLAMASVRSVGWNLGTIRELGGGMKDIATGGGDTPGELSHRAAYMMALPITVGLYGAMYQYLRTGQGPQELKDYFYPKTGETDQDGNPERVQLPSYNKDLMAYAGSPWQTVKHKMAPVPSAIYEMLQNQDFYGDEIRNPNDPLVKQVQQEAEYIGKSFVPFGVRNIQEQSGRSGAGTLTKAQNFVGITPAPRSVVRSPAQNEMADDIRQTMPATRTPEQREVMDARANLIAALRRGDTSEIQSAMTDAAQKGMTERQIAGAAKASAPNQHLVNSFKRLTIQQATSVWAKASDRERQLWADAFATKLLNARKR